LEMDLDDLFKLGLQPQLAPQHQHAATTSTSRGRSATHRRLFRLLVSTRKLVERASHRN
jgi:hypothetical protein